MTVLKGLLPGEVLCLGLKSIREVSHRDGIYIYYMYILLFHSVCSGELPACDTIKSRFGGSCDDTVHDTVQELCGETTRESHES